MAPKGGVRKRVLEDISHDNSGAASSSDVDPSARRSIRSRVVAETHQPVASELPLLQTLKRDWGKGLLSSRQVQEYSLAAEKQGAIGMSAAAAAGSSGKNPQNLQRSLLHVFGKPAGSPEFTWCEVATKRGKQLHPFMLPHMWFSSLFEQCPQQFEAALRGPDRGCEAFWHLMADTPFFKEHPGIDRSKLAHTIPVGFYGDAGAVSQQDSLMAFTWNSILGIGGTSAKKS